MRLVTRSDFDGLACGALLKEVGLVDSWKFAHPKDLQDGLVEINENDVGSVLRRRSWRTRGLPRQAAGPSGTGSQRQKSRKGHLRRGTM